MQTPLTPEQAKELAMRWKAATPMSEEQRERDIRAADTGRAIDVLADAFEDALDRYPPVPTSGMVEMQRYFLRARKRSTSAQHHGSEPC